MPEGSGAKGPAGQQVSAPGRPSATPGACYACFRSWLLPDTRRRKSALNLWTSLCHRRKRSSRPPPFSRATDWLRVALRRDRGSWPGREVARAPQDRDAFILHRHVVGSIVVAHPGPGPRQVAGQNLLPSLQARGLAAQEDGAASASGSSAQRLRANRRSRRTRANLGGRKVVSSATRHASWPASAA